MKNVVLFHLESLNNLFYLMHPECFPNLLELANNGTSFSKYYSSATSTLMVITDLFFQDTNQFENSTYLEDIYSITPVKKSFTDSFYNNGYNLHYFVIGKNIDYGSEPAEVFVNKVSPYFKYNYFESPKNIYSELENIINEKPFFLFVQDDESHISQIHTYEDNSDLSSYELYKYRYKRIDEAIGQIIKALKDNNIFDDTIIMLYGDHGDELYWHNLYEGYTHAIEPYSNLIYCPLIVHGAPGDLQEKRSQLLTTTNLGDMLLYSADLKESFSNTAYVFSRNLFRNQGLCLDKFNKSYSVTDGNYLLIVSNNGLEMYMNTIDYSSKCNILNFFKLKNNKIYYNSVFDFLMSSHYKYFMTKKTIEDITAEFSLLREKLYEHLLELYDRKIRDMNFVKINYEIKYAKKYNILKRRALKRKLKDLVKSVLK